MRVSRTIWISGFTVMALACTSCQRQESRTVGKSTGTLVLPISDQEVAVSTESGKSIVRINGEVRFQVAKTQEGVQVDLKSFRLVGSSVKTRQGDSGTISATLSPRGAVTRYDPKALTITSDLVADVHYRLIDQLKGFREPPKEAKEMDDFRPYTEEFAGQLVCRLKEPLERLGGSRTRAISDGAKLEIVLKLADRVVGAIEAFRVDRPFELAEIIWIPIYIRQSINIQPVFIRYDASCSGGGTATTGGSYTVGRDKAIEMWSRCCVDLNFLSPVYVANDDYRILSADEESDLRAEYDDPQAVEVFFVEASDPVGRYGGGACWGSGTAGAQIITHDTNLPINNYNLAHELGHALGLHHPPSNSTPGSLMEPSGFCADNPALMSGENCDNIDNPLLRTPRFPWVICRRNTNMP